MKLLDVPPLPFTDGTAYENIDLHKYTIVPAQYNIRKDLGNNPDACALPRLLCAAELITKCKMPLPGYDREEVLQMPEYARKEAILSIQSAYYVLGHYFDLAVAIDRALMTSYMGRELRISSNTDGRYGGVLCSVRNDDYGRASSFVMTGQTGCGKTVAMNRIKRLYPVAIQHSIGGYEYIQIPILMSTSKVGNLKELIMSLGDKLDEILDCGHAHATQVNNKNVGMACNTLSRWIKKYHIGIVIIDEFEFMNLNVGTGSFENVVSIAEETGCALGLIGNLDGKEKLLKHPRLVNRVMQSSIDVGCSRKTDQIFFEKALMDLWRYQFCGKPLPLSEGIKAELLHQSLYNISLLKAIIMDIQYEATKKYPVSGITQEWVKSICDHHFGVMRTLLLEGSPESDINALQEARKIAEKIRKEAAEELEDAKMKAATSQNKEDFSEENRYKLKTVEAILNFQGYALIDINKAIRIAIKKNQTIEFESEINIARYVKTILDKCKEENTKKETKGNPMDTSVEKQVKEVVLDNL